MTAPSGAGPQAYLAPPPRAVPFGVRVQQVFGGVVSQLGWCFLTVGLVFAWVFVPMADLSFLQGGGSWESAPARVKALRRTNATVNNRHVYAVDYEFRTPTEALYRGTAYCREDCPQEGAGVAAEFSPDRPEVSRIPGLARAVFPPFVLFVLVFPLIGAAFIAVSLVMGLGRVRLLVVGKPAAGRVVEKVPTSTRINNRTVYRMTLAFTDERGAQQRAEVRTHQPDLLEDEARERLLYDPERPERIVALDALPGPVDADPLGGLRARHPGRTFWFLISPGVCLLGNAAFIWWRYLAR